MTAADGFPCIDLYARPRKHRLKHERLNRVESLWVGAALVLAIVLEGAFIREQLNSTEMVSTHAAEIGRLEAQKAQYERNRAAYAQVLEQHRGGADRLEARTGWLRLLQAVSAVTTQNEALEQCTLDGRTQRAVILSGSAINLTELQALLQRLKAVACFKNVRLVETAADKNFGPESIHFRIDTRCNAADLNRETSAP